MSSPEASAGFGAASSGLGAVLSAAGAYSSAKSAKNAANTNAMLAEHQALDAMVRGQQEFDRSNTSYAQVKGRQIAGLAANGFDVGQGSALDILTSTDLAKQTDAAIIRNNAEREAWGYNVNAAQYRAQARSIKPELAAVTSLLGSASDFSSKWDGWRGTTRGGT